MTDLHARAAALLAAAEKMTPGPWSADLMYVVGNVPAGRPGGEVIARCGPTVPLTLPNEANSHGIVALRNEAPALIRELLEENERLQVTIYANTSTIAADDSLYRGNSVRYWYDKLTARTAENERLRARVAELESKVGPAMTAEAERLGLYDAGPAPFQGRTTRRNEN